MISNLKFSSWLTDFPLLSFLCRYNSIKWNGKLFTFSFCHLDSNQCIVYVCLELRCHQLNKTSDFFVCCCCCGYCLLLSFFNLLHFPYFLSWILCFLIHHQKRKQKSNGKTGSLFTQINLHNNYDHFRH